MMGMRMLLKVSIICLLAFIQNPSPVESEMSGQDTVILGETIALQCTHEETWTNIIWYKDMEEIEATSDRVRIRNTPYRSRLTVYRADLGDAGVYSCGIDGQSTVESMTVQVVVGGLVLNVTGRQRVWPGCPLQLECDMIGDPLLVQWYKDGVSRGNRRRFVGRATIVLQVENPTSEDSGLYECKMPNNSTGSQQVQILDEEGETMSLQGLEYVGLGCSIELTCEVEANPFLVTWYKDNEPLDPDLSSGSCDPSIPLSVLHIEKASSSDAGRYECRTAAGNTRGMHVHVFDTRVDVFGATEVEKGDPLELTCETMGQADCVSVWWKGGRRMYPQEDDSSFSIETTQISANTARTTLQIESTTARDDGWYTCGNPIGNSHSFRVHIEDVDTVVQLSGAQHVMAGEPITLACEVTGTSPSSVIWHRDTTRLVSGVTHFIQHDALISFFEKDSTLEDAGTYHCRTTDGDTASITVLVLE